VSRPSRRVGLVGLVVTLALVAAACGGGDGEPETTTTTAAPTTTTRAPTTTTTVDERAIAPLTGLRVDDAEILAVPAISVKIDNAPQARPQRGLNQADVVIEEFVEGITRFFAVFHAIDSDPVGPVRSARTSDIDLLPMFGRPLFANSGGNPGTMGALRRSGVAVLATQDDAPALYRRDADGEIGRRAPHNLLTDTSALRSFLGADGVPPGAIFGFRPADEPVEAAAAEPVLGLRVGFGGTRAEWVWDADAESFLRWQDGTPHVDADDVQVAAANVALLVTPYRASPADPRSPEAVTVGSGEAWILTDGHLVFGSWERTGPAERYILRDTAGEEILLTPGRTWIGLPRAGNISRLEVDPRVAG